MMHHVFRTIVFISISPMLIFAPPPPPHAPHPQNHDDLIERLTPLPAIDGKGHALQVTQGNRVITRHPNTNRVITLHNIIFPL